MAARKRKSKNDSTNGASNGAAENSTEDSSEEKAGLDSGTMAVVSGESESSGRVGSAESESVEASESDDNRRDKVLENSPSDAIKEAFAKGVNSGNFDVAKAAMRGFTEDELRNTLIELYPPGSQKELVASIFLKCSKDEMAGLFGTHCAIFGMGIAVGERKAISDMQDKQS